jgi:hypothetical protein
LFIVLTLTRIDEERSGIDATHSEIDPTLTLIDEEKSVIDVAQSEADATLTPIDPSKSERDDRKSSSDGGIPTSVRTRYITLPRWDISDGPPEMIHRT